MNAAEAAVGHEIRGCDKLAAPVIFCAGKELIHSAALSSSHGSCVRSVGSRIGLVGDKALGGEDHCRDGSRVLESGTSDLGGVKDACGSHVAILILSEVVAVADLAGFENSVDDNGAFKACVGGYLADGLLKSFKDYLDAGLFVGVLGALKQSLDAADCVQQSDAAACNAAFLDSRLGGRKSVI